VVFLKSGLGIKVALGVLGVLLGFGGVTAGANWHAAHTPNLAHRRLLVGHVVSFDGTTLVVQARNGRMVKLAIVAGHTTVRHRGKAAQLANVQPGELVLVHVTQRKGKLYVLFISILAPKQLPQGP
jgi:hypothetical protein